MVRSNNENTIYDEGCDVNNKNSVELAAYSVPAGAPKPSREFSREVNDNSIVVPGNNNLNNSESESQSISFEEVKEGGGDDDSLLLA